MNCARCQGFLLTQYSITRCLNCGFHENPIIPEAHKVEWPRANGYRTTQCPRGHVYTEATSYFYTWAGDGRKQRKCLTCARMKLKHRKPVQA
jgi:hypothetical protein